MNGRRGHGEGGISHRKDGRWEARIDLGYENGKRRRKAIYGKTRKEVAQKLHAALKAKQDGVIFVPENQNVATYLADWLEAVRPTVRERTHHRYEQYVRLHIVPTLGKVRLAKLTPQHLRSLYSSKLAEGLSPTTVVHLHRVLHGALKQAGRWDLVPRNVADLVDPPRMNRAEMATLSAIEVRRLFEVARSHRLEALFVVAITTGMRQGELLALHWRDLDLDAGTVKVRGSLQRMRDNRLAIVEPKTAKSRRLITLSETGIEALRRHRARQATERLRLGPAWVDEDLVFTNMVGRPVSATNLLHRDFYPLLERAGLPKVRFHDLRHTAATLLLEGNVNTKVVSEMLGHTQVGVTMDLYQHVTPTMQQHAADTFDALLAVNLVVNGDTEGHKTAGQPS